MKKLLIIFSVVLLCSNVIAGDKNKSTKQKELEKKIQLLEKELELEKLKDQLKEEKEKKDKSSKAKTAKRIDASTDASGVLESINLLGTFKEPTRYPKGMKKIIGNCKNFSCISKKAMSKMSLIFKRTSKYNARHPGSQIHGMALFEIFYLEQLKKKEKKINQFLAGWPDDRKNARAVVAIIKLNKSREKMRKALGMDLNTSTEDAMEIFWLMGDFLEQGKIKKQKVSKDIKRRKVLLANYKKTINKFSSALKKKEDEEFYKKITDKK